MTICGRHGKDEWATSGVFHLMKIISTWLFGGDVLNLVAFSFGGIQGKTNDSVHVESGPGLRIT